MSALVIGTAAVSLDEPCLLLKEEHLNWQGRGVQRVQTIVVMRGDRPAEHQRALGPVEGFRGVSEFRMPGGVQDAQTKRYEIFHTVGELIDIADRYRHGVERTPEMEPSDLIAGYHERVDQQRSRRRGRVFSGPRR